MRELAERVPDTRLVHRDLYRGRLLCLAKVSKQYLVGCLARKFTYSCVFRATPLPQKSTLQTPTPKSSESLKLSFTAGYLSHLKIALKWRGEGAVS